MTFLKSFIQGKAKAYTHKLTPTMNLKIKSY